MLRGVYCGLVFGLSVVVADGQVIPGTVTVYNEGSSGFFFTGMADVPGHHDNFGLNWVAPGGEVELSCNTYLGNGGWTLGGEDVTQTYMWTLWVGQPGASAIVGYVTVVGSPPVASGSVTPPASNALFCVNIANTSGQDEFFGLVDETTGAIIQMDSCGDNAILVPAGGSSGQVCVTAPNGHTVSTWTQPVGSAALGMNQGGCNGSAFNIGSPDGSDVLGSPLTGTPIPDGSSGTGGVTDTNNLSFGTQPGTGVLFTNTAGSNAPIEFGSTNLASTVIAGDQAEFSELVLIASEIASQSAGDAVENSRLNLAVGGVDSQLVVDGEKLDIVGADVLTAGGTVAGAVLGASNAVVQSGAVMGASVSNMSSAIVGALTNVVGAIGTGTNSLAGQVASVAGGVSNVVSAVDALGTNLVWPTNYPDAVVISNTSLVSSELSGAAQMSNALAGWSAAWASNGAALGVASNLDVSGVSNGNRYIGLMANGYGNPVGPLPASLAGAMDGEVDIALPSDGVSPPNLVLSMAMLPPEVLTIIGEVKALLAALLWTQIYFPMWRYAQQCVEKSYMQRQLEGSGQAVLGTNAKVAIALSYAVVIVPLFVVLFAALGQYILLDWNGGGGVSIADAWSTVAGASPLMSAITAFVPIDTILAVASTWVMFRYVVGFGLMMTVRSAILVMVA